MKRFSMCLAGAAFGAALAAAPAHAGVTIYDLGTLGHGTAVYSGQTGSGGFTSYVKFGIATAPTDASVTYSDSVRFATQLITGGVLKLFACTANCTGTALTPLAGALIDSAAVVAGTATTQGAAFGPSTLLTAGEYFLQLSGSTTAPAPAGITYAGTITLSSAVPEASTWAMMLVGFAGLAFATTRRRKAAAVSA